MKYKQVKLQRGFNNDSLVEFQTPICSSFEGTLCTIYRIIGSSGGMSDESGEMLRHAFVRKETSNRSDGTMYGDTSIAFEDQHLTLYINEQGDAYRTWKGKLKGRPVCNFKTGYIYKYVHPSREQHYIDKLNSLKESNKGETL